MLNFLPGPLLGVLAFTLIFLNTVFWFLGFIPFIILRILLPFAGAGRFFSGIMIQLATYWVYCNSAILKLTQTTQWEIHGVEALDLKRSYLVMSNHQSWTDIFVLQHVFKGKIPFLMFFIKQELIWIPFLGQAWWALGMPFMKRYTREYLEANPHKRGKDLETTRKACAKFRGHPVSVINFVEGSRFTPAKKEKQKSPYDHLLKPRAGGVSLTLAAMGDCFDYVLDVTIVYSGTSTQKLIWKLMSKQVPKIEVYVNKLPVPENVVERNYLEDQEFQEQMKAWINKVWDEKDAFLKSKVS